ncbi:hypothetical protein [Streptomyces sp. NPDC048611]|uniref:hypothetical protein n=1 Tax=Streptomyces sp. NPDC048611 TaxID=3155635 RepID=UPI0034496CF0
MNRTHISDLARALRVLGSHGESLGLESSAATLDEIHTDLSRALDLMRIVNRPRPTTDCARHPYGPVDEEAINRCLLCGTHERRARYSGQADRPAEAYRQHY